MIEFLWGVVITVIAFMIIIAIFILGPAKIDRETYGDVKVLVEECEAHIPRDQHCKVIKAEVIK